MQKQIHYWFKRRRFGWGWVPVTWQGAATILVGIGVILFNAFQLPKPAQTNAGQIWMFLAVIVLVVIIWIIIAYYKGPKPHWRWGKSPNDNPDEDF